MIYVILQYWEFLAVALLIGIVVGWWGEASHGRRQSKPAPVSATADGIVSGRE